MKTPKRLLLVIIILLILHIILLLIRIPVEVKVKELSQIPYNDTEFYYILEPNYFEKCNQTDYSWEYSWQGWMPPKNNQISPILRIKNIDNLSGEFIVYFAFFDNKLFNYNDYRGENYQDVRDRLPWDAASMFSPSINMFLQPSEARDISIYTEKTSQTSQYWAYADITIPTKKICKPAKNYTNTTKSRAVVKHAIKNITTTKTNSITLLSYIYNLWS